MATVLKAPRYIYLKQNEDGRILEKKRYNRGDDLSDLPADERDRLISLGVTRDDAEKATDDAEQAEGSSGTPDDSEGQDGAEDVEDEYSEMSYADLQQTAKDRGLNAGGSADDLRARLREADAE